MKLRILNYIIFSIVSMLVFAHTIDAQEKIYSFGIVPQQSARKTAFVWEPILKHITEKTGIQLKLKTNKNIPEFEEHLKNERYDISYMNPYHYTVYHDRANYHALAKSKRQKN